MRRLKAAPCQKCASERRARIALGGDKARLRWDLQKARNRMREIAQQTAALASTLEAELMKVPTSEDPDPLS